MMCITQTCHHLSPATLEHLPGGAGTSKLRVRAGTAAPDCGCDVGAMSSIALILLVFCDVYHSDLPPPQSHHPWVASLNLCPVARGLQSCATAAPDCGYDVDAMYIIALLLLVFMMCITQTCHHVSPATLEHLPGGAGTSKLRVRAGTAAPDCGCDVGAMSSIALLLLVFYDVYHSDLPPPQSRHP